MQIELKTPEERVVMSRSQARWFLIGFVLFCPNLLQPLHADDTVPAAAMAEGAPPQNQAPDTPEFTENAPQDPAKTAEVKVDTIIASLQTQLTRLWEGIKNGNLQQGNQAAGEILEILPRQILDGAREDSTHFFNALEAREKAILHVILDLNSALNLLQHKLQDAILKIPDSTHHATRITTAMASFLKAAFKNRKLEITRPKPAPDSPSQRLKEDAGAARVAGISADPKSEGAERAKRPGESEDRRHTTDTRARR